MRGVILLTAMLAFGLFGHAQTRYHITMGEVEFTSDAPLELIEAKTFKILGILDVDRRAFAVSIPISTFRGFNSGLQREHFNENYMETAKFPKGVFKGLIMDDIDFRQNGFYQITAKGQLKLHGIEKVREIKCDVTVSEDLVTVKSRFNVELSDHNIKIPKVVFDKLSEVVTVKMEADFVLKR